MVLSLNKICRTCLIEAPALLSIYEKQTDTNGGTNTKSVMEMLMSFTSVKIETNGALPDSLCLSCISEINRAYSFKEKCERSDLTLKAYLHQIIKEEQLVKKETSAINPNLSLLDLGEITELLTSQEAIKINECSLTDSSAIIAINQNNQNILTETGHPNNMNYEISNSKQECEVEVLDKEDELGLNLFVLIYKCNFCSSHFDDNSTFKEHMMCNHSAMYCELCDTFFYDSFKDHFKNVHDFEGEDEILPQKQSKKALGKTEVNLKCKLCDSEFGLKKHLDKHLLRCHKVKDNIIEKLQDTVEKNNEIKLDNDRTANIVDNGQNLEGIIDKTSPFKCSKCNATFVKEKSYRLHHNSNKCTELSYPCKLCNKVFAHRKNLQQHLLAHEQTKFRCKECSKVFTSSEDLVLHNQEHASSKKYQCVYCGKGFNMISTLKDHVRIHNGEKPFLCSICGKGFSQSTNLRQHVMRHNKIKPYKCEVCEYAFVSKGELEAHLRKHTGDHPFVCNICETGFTTSSALVKHKRIHTGEKPYACEYCPMRFAANGVLKNHRRTHTGERPFECKFCDRKFTQRSDMVSHTRTHTGERPYACSGCGVSFHQSNKLKAHLKSHEACDKKLTQTEG